MEENQITLEQLYNYDLYYQTKTPAVQSEKQASGMKKQKDCVILMGCSQGSAHTGRQWPKWPVPSNIRPIPSKIWPVQLLHIWLFHVQYTLI